MAPVDDTSIGIVFTFILGLGVFFLTLFSMGSGGGTGIQAAHTLFGSIFGLSSRAALLAAVIALAVTLCTVAIARPLLFASVAPEVAAARGVPTRLLGVGFLAILGVVVAEASQVVGALLLLGLLAAPAGAAQRLARSPPPGSGCPRRLRSERCGEDSCSPTRSHLCRRAAPSSPSRSPSTTARGC